MTRSTNLTPERPLLVYGPWSARYDLGPAHPLTPRRFAPAIELLTAMSDGQPRLLSPEPASDAVLEWVHDPAYIRIVRRMGDFPFGPREAGLGPGDTPAFPGMHDAAAAVAGGSVGAIEAIIAGETLHAFHPGGGLHHAMPAQASGFCIYDDPAVAIARARRAGLRVLYVDLDVHHGDGVQAIHWDDPGVLTFSIHQSGATLFPGSGFIEELGEGEAAGTAVNLPLDPGTGEDAWLAALKHLLPALAASFGPDLVVSQHGADAHAWDPLANLRITTTAMGKAARLVDAVAHRWAGGRWLATGGGGYDVYRVVPRTWTLVWLAASHREPSGPIPAAWRERWTTDADRYGQAPLPTTLEDLPNAGLAVDAAQVAADRRAGCTAAALDELVIPALLRAGHDAGWWIGLGNGATDGIATSAAHAEPTAVPEPAAAQGAPGAPQVHADVDAASWSAWTLAPRTIAPADSTEAHALLLAALRSGSGVRVTAAVVGRQIVGAVVSAASGALGGGALGGGALGGGALGGGALGGGALGGGALGGGALSAASGALGAGALRRLLAVGVAPDHRRAGLAGAMLSQHLATMGDGVTWDALITLAERDPFEPLPRAIRARVARRLLETAGFVVGGVVGPIGEADPAALLGRRR